MFRRAEASCLGLSRLLLWSNACGSTTMGAVKEVLTYWITSTDNAVNGLILQQ
jgi:hypothetical protein